jgi:hypothetical protein
MVDGKVARRRAHVMDLLDRHEITSVYLSKGESGGSADLKGRVVLIPQTTMVRSYYIALHEIGHIVLGFDRDRPKAPQEAAAWRWAINCAIEEPTPGVSRMIFLKLWNYLLGDLLLRPGEKRSNADRFPGPGDEFWLFLASLDEASRLLYGAVKVTAHSGTLKALEDHI